MRAWLIAGLALIVAAMVWLAAMNEQWKFAYCFSGRQDDYYSLLVHGFLQGHLSMDLPGNGATPPLDASFYHGKYYLYFGVVPAALAFLPYRLLTGQDLSENAVCLLLVLLGFLLYLRTYFEAKRRYFPGLSPTVQAGSLLLFAFGAGTPFLLIVSHWYEVAIAGGYACMAGAWLGMFRAWDRPDHRGRWLGWASLAIGLAAGCRPDYVFALPGLAGLALVLMHRAEKGARGRLAAAAVLPAGLMGLLLMAYNYSRFGNPLEFGFHYQISQLVASGLPLARASFFWPNLKWYYLRPPAFSPYFPYVFPAYAGDRPSQYYGGETIQGQAPVLILGLLCLGWLWRQRRARAGTPPGLAGFLPLVGAVFACLFLSMAFFGFRASRYMVDFQGSLVLLLALSGGCCATAPGPDRTWSWAGRAGFGLLAAVAGLGNVLGGIQLGQHLEQPRPRTYQFLGYYGNYPSLFLEKLGLLHYGPVHFQAVFSPVTRTTTQPLLAMGVPDYTDVLWAIETPPNLIELRLDHAGQPGPRSRPIAVEFGRAYDIEVDLGALYPPRNHPFRQWSSADIDRLKTTARVRFGDEDAIYQKMKSFDSPPNWVFFGRNPAEGNSSFAGQILSPRQLPPRPRAALDPFGQIGIWRLQLGFSSPATPSSQPVLASGVAGHGNLLLVDRLGDQTIRFGLDQWGSALTSSPPIKLTPGLHRLEVFVGAQVAQQKLPPAWGLDPGALKASDSVLRVWLDGQPSWTAMISSNRDSYGQVIIGGNPQGFSSAGDEWQGSLGFLPYAPEEMKAFIERNLQETAASGQ